VQMGHAQRVGANQTRPQTRGLDARDRVEQLKQLDARGWA
jgi:hypothetical protein